MTKNLIKKSLGFWTSLSLVIGNIIGAGIFLLPASLAVYGNISLVAWLFTTIGAILLALLFSKLNQRMPHTGGAFLYSYHVYGEFVGFAVAAGYWFSWCVANASMAVALIGFLGYFWPIVQEQSVYYNVWVALAVKLGVIWGMTFINIRGIHLVGKIQLVTTVLKLIPLILIGVVGLFKMKWGNLIHFYNISGKTDLTALLGCITLTIYAFIGLESAVVPADEISDTQVITKATIIGTLVCGVIYILDMLVLLGLFSAPHLKNSTAPFVEAAVALFGPATATFIALSAIISIVGCINGSLLIQVQDAMAAANHRLFPKIFAKKGRFDTATWGFIISAIFMSLVLLLTIQKNLVAQFNFLVLLTTLSMLIPYFISATAELMLLLKNPEQLNPKRLLLSTAVTFLASIFSFSMILGAGSEVISAGGLLFFAMFWFYWLMQYFKTK